MRSYASSLLYIWVRDMEKVLHTFTPSCFITAAWCVFGFSQFLLIQPPISSDAAVRLLTRSENRHILQRVLPACSGSLLAADWSSNPVPCLQSTKCVFPPPVNLCCCQTPQILRTKTPVCPQIRRTQSLRHVAFSANSPKLWDSLTSSVNSLNFIEDFNFKHTLTHQLLLQLSVAICCTQLILFLWINFAANFWLKLMQMNRQHRGETRWTEVSYQTNLDIMSLTSHWNICAIEVTLLCLKDYWYVLVKLS